MAPTLPTTCGSLPSEGAAAPAARRSRFRGPCWCGRGGMVALALCTRCSSLPLSLSSCELFCFLRRPLLSGFLKPSCARR